LTKLGREPETLQRNMRRLLIRSV